MYGTGMINTLIHQFNRDVRTRRSVRERERRPVTRTQSAPHRRPGHAKHALKRQTSSEALPTADHEEVVEPNQPQISSPKTVSERGTVTKALLFCLLS